MDITGLIENLAENGGSTTITPKFETSLYIEDIMEEYVGKVVRINIEVLEEIY